MEEAAAVDGEISSPADVRVEGQDAGPWYGMLPEEYQANPAITRYTSVEEFAKGFLERGAQLGKQQGVQFPGDEATPEDWQAFWRQVPGYPETPSAYAVEPPTFPEGSPYDLAKDDYTDFLGAMHQAGVSPQHVNAMMRWFEGNEAKRWEEALSETQESVTHGENTLIQKWGSKTDFNVRVAEEGIMREFGTLDFLDQLVTKEGDSPKFLRNSPEFIQMAYEWSLSKGHDKYVAGGPGGPATVDAAQQQMSEARTAYRNGTMSSEAFTALQTKLAPMIFGDDDGIMASSMTGIDLEDR